MFDYGGEVRGTIQAASHASAHANELATRKSTDRFLYRIFNDPIEWRARCQDTVTTSATKYSLSRSCSQGNRSPLSTMPNTLGAAGDSDEDLGSQVAHH